MHTLSVSVSPLSFHPPTDDMGDGEGGVVVTASLAVAVTALLFAFFTTILVLGMLYVLIRVKADVRKLRAGEITHLHMYILSFLLSCH